MAACSHFGEQFLVFFHKAAEVPLLSIKAFYAVEFGIKKHAKVCHVASFDAIG